MGKMVSDAKAAEWASWLDGVAPKPRPITTLGMARALLAERETLLGLAEIAVMAGEYTTCAERLLVIRAEARKLLKEVGR